MFQVTVTLQAPNNEPVTLNYLRKGDALTMMNAVTSALTAMNPDVPESIRTRVVSITITNLS